MTFRHVPFTRCSPGLIAQLLNSSYAPLMDGLPTHKAEELVQSWQEYDAAVYADPETIGASGFFSLLGDEIIGLGSWDPRQWPEVGIIGHNCIVPQHQNRGHGRRQIEEILRRFTDAGFRKAIVCTDEHPFFGPARQMYLSCGFKESCRHQGTLFRNYCMIEYERSTQGKTV